MEWLDIVDAYDTAKGYVEEHTVAFLVGSVVLNLVTWFSWMAWYF